MSLTDHLTNTPPHLHTCITMSTTMVFRASLSNTHRLFFKIILVATALSRQFKNIYVLSGFHYEKHKEFIQAIVVLSRVIADRKLHLIYGGDNQGLSKLVLEVIFIKGSQVLSSISKALKPLRCLHNPLTGKELVFPSMQERIFEMLNHADSFIFWLGDLATIEVLITFVS